MTTQVSYFAATISPWTYLGHEAFCKIAKQTGAIVDLKVMDLAKVFPVSGGLPLKQRAAQRQAYRLQELTRWKNFRQLPMHIQPTFFPADASLASLITLYLRDHMSTPIALNFLGAAMRLIWEQQGNIADLKQLTQLLKTQGLAENVITFAQDSQTIAAYEADTNAAITAQVFGAPTYCIADQMYWGQDRLDFVERHLSSLQCSAKA